MQKIATCLWFDDNAEEAVNFYVSIIRNSRVRKISRYTGAGQEVHGRPEGSVMVVVFELDDREFMALNGGPHFKLTEAISLRVNCESQTEVDTLWETLSAGGEKSQCGWLKDKFGLSWQIVPTVLDEMMGDKDTKKAARVMTAMLKMQKLDIATLKRAFEQG
ncbi:MAG: VOC family protein [Rhizomicrobium sp.]|jgi:predicted 3-demethylubiquinone-9 3-methyltransferase (glyoxalase superfamily)